MPILRDVHTSSSQAQWKPRFWWASIAALLGVALAFAWWRVRSYELEPSRASHPFRIAYHTLPPEQGVGANLVGSANEIFQEACRRRKVPVQLVQIHEEPAQALREGKIDLVPVVFDTPEDRKDFYISDPWVMDSGWMVSLDSSGISSPEQVRGKRVWYQDNIRHSYLARTNFSGAELQAQDSFTTAVEGVCQGKAEAALVSPVEAGIKSFFEHLPACQGLQLRFSPLPNARIWFGVGAMRNNPAATVAADAVRQEIGRMVEDGSLGRIYLKWGLDPNNAATVIQYLTILRQRSFYMTVAVFVLMAVLLMLSWLAWRLRKARRIADLANAAKTQFLANMSHEIRTPLNGVIGMTRMALSTPLNADQREWLGVASASADVLLSVVNEILDFSKLESGKLRIEDLEINVIELVESSAKAFALPAQEKKLELICDIDPACPTFVRGDPVRLRQVLFNLLSNAVKFTATGEIKLKLAIDKSDSGPLLHFSLSDTGVGIARQKHDVIFEPFSQEDSSTTRKFGGTGLGLSISRRLVQLMGGKIWFNSEEEKGATFSFTLPLHTGNDVSSEVNMERWPGVPVLVVDDNASACDVIARTLQTASLDVTCASDATAALEELRRSKAAGLPHSILLLDSEMPGMDGFELASQIRDSFGPGTAIVMMLTSQQCSFTPARCSELGIAVHLLKPVGRTELLATVRQVLNGAPAVPSRELPIQTVLHQRRTSPQLNVLLAEDNLVNRKVALAMLQRAGHTVTVAATGKEAVNLAQNQRFDLILMDIQMPEMDGLEATQMIRQSRTAASARAPIIAITAHALKGDSERFLAAGLDGYIAKPFQQQDLFEALERVRSSVPASHGEIAIPAENANQ
ncbi:MAG TPA: response regulator [Candidatus Acidoferrales bacterium]|nr:response regulator [Candidatus Acidoferrales bacterium]